MIGKKICNRICIPEVSQRQHFNYLRNNSSSVYDVFNWRSGSQVTEETFQKVNYNPQNLSNIPNKGEQNNNRRVVLSDRSLEYKQPPIADKQQANQQNLNGRKSVLKKKNINNRPVSASANKLSRTKLQQEAEQQRARKRIQNKRKVQDYINSFIPCSRNLTNTRFQEYFGKPAPQAYGRANVTQRAGEGGIIYGNYMKSFNINPHSYTNQPQYYQTHQTAMNYGKRTKLNQEQKFTKLERALTKKLGLNEYNHILKQGKNVNYVDIDESNMNQAMKQNTQFIKNHRQEIRDYQNQVKKQLEDEKKLTKQQFYLNKNINKEASLNQTLNKSTIASTFFEGKGEDQRIKEQVIYRYHDQNGNIVLAPNRHAITCYVDMNFPQNDQAYTAHLNSIKPIFPTPTKDKDRNLDSIRIQNYQKSLHNFYPPHYLLPNCQQPQIIKMYQKNDPRFKNINKSYKKITSKNQSNIKINQNSKNKSQNKSYSNINVRQEANYGKADYQRQGANVQSNLKKQKEQILMKASTDNDICKKIMDERSNYNSIGLPLNEKNPYYYKKASDQIGHVPVAGNPK